jgi:ribosomal protein L37AE/L43A
MAEKRIERMHCEECERTTPHKLEEGVRVCVRCKLKNPPEAQ